MAIPSKRDTCIAPRIANVILPALIMAIWWLSRRICRPPATRNCLLPPAFDQVWVQHVFLAGYGPTPQDGPFSAVQTVSNVVCHVGSAPASAEPEVRDDVSRHRHSSAAGAGCDFVTGPLTRPSVLLLAPLCRRPARGHTTHDAPNTTEPPGCGRSCGLQLPGARPSSSDLGAGDAPSPRGHRVEFRAGVTVANVSVPVSPFPRYEGVSGTNLLRDHELLVTPRLFVVEGLTSLTGRGD